MDVVVLENLCVTIRSLLIKFVCHNKEPAYSVAKCPEAYVFHCS
jgi:hypothetical protein